MALHPGRPFGAYEILSALGAGGMGEVYRARDTKLGRDVALKILPDTFAHDRERLARFQREAQLLASLNHPHIAAIYGLEDAPGIRALVLELVDGPTLADRIAKGAVPVDEALSIAQQIADALEAAHGQGIIHRDLKPANIKLRPDGVVKVLDFGLAKAMEPAAIHADLTNSPTITTPAEMTGVGTVLGTAAYMSPEQAKGLPADTRSDVWAFGCVLFEMLAGARAFPGDHISEVLAGVIKDDPPWATLPATTPPALLRLLRRCLRKNRRERLQHIGDARLEIEEVAEAPETDGGAGRGGLRRGERLAWIGLAAVLAVTATLSGLRAFRPATPAAEVRFEIATPPTSDPISLAISPDGTMVVFTATDEGRQRLWLHSLSAVSSRPLPGTDGGFYPFWSPDSRSIGFFAGGKLNRIDLDGGLVRPLANASGPLGGTWGRDGTILFAPNYTGAIFRIGAAGGEAVPVTRTQTRQVSHRFPQFLPDGRHFLYYVPGGAENRGVYVADIDGGTATRLLTADAPAVFSAPRQLLFVSQRRLIVQEFDPATLVLSGRPSPVADEVVAVGESNLAAMSASAVGALVYRTGGGTGQRQFIWFDRSGRQTGTAVEPDNGGLQDPSLSRDGRRLAFARTINGNTDIWTLDLDRRLPSRLTFDETVEAGPIWSPDGTRMLFNSNRKGAFDLYQKPAAGTGGEDLLLATPQNKGPLDWSPDGRFVLYRSPALATGFDLWVLPVDGSRQPFPVVQTPFEERDGQFSPDGKWIAYQTNESGRVEIVVQPFPGPGGKLQVSSNGGAQVRWRRDGKELYYIALDGVLMAVPIRLATDGRAIEADVPVPLFATRVGGAVQAANPQQYVVSPAGDRFLMNTVTSEASVAPITVILNWRPPSGQ